MKDLATSVMDFFLNQSVAMKMSTFIPTSIICNGRIQTKLNMLDQYAIQSLLFIIDIYATLL